MTDARDILDRARDAHDRRDWQSALALYDDATAAGVRPTADDLRAVSDAAWWLGRIDDALDAAQDAFHAFVADDRPLPAAMTGLDAAVMLVLRGDEVMASGWLGRVERLLADEPESPVHGYLRYIVEVEGGLDGGNTVAVADAAVAVREIGERHAVEDLVALGLLGQGRALIRQGDVDRGLSLLDEAVVAVRSERLRPEWAGNIYCHLMAACHEIADIARARECTRHAATWLDRHAPAPVFTGICRLHRSQVLQLAGEWARAEAEAVRVCRELETVHVETVAEAWYQIGDLRRLRGDLSGAEVAFREARARGRDPQPGMALVHLASGDGRRAVDALTAALTARSDDALARAPLCRAVVDAALAAARIDPARQACDELEATAATYRTSGLEAAALDARGAVTLAEGRTGLALPTLRAAARRWHRLGSRYDAARVRLRLATAYSALGDEDAAAAERAVADDITDGLGASPDVLRSVVGVGSPAPPGGLTAREAEVLALVATGRTNRGVAETLVLSEKTVARHLSNIFTKLGVATRTEAAAYAFAHGLAPPADGSCDPSAD